MRIFLDDMRTGNYRRLWSARFDALDHVVEALKKKEKADGRKE